jgi:hypothetical protein
MAWLEQSRLPLPPGASSQPDPDTALAIRAWNWMGGALDWSGLPLVAELLGIHDLERLITQLAAIRDWQRKQ